MLTAAGTQDADSQRVMRVPHAGRPRRLSRALSRQARQPLAPLSHRSSPGRRSLLRLVLVLLRQHAHAMSACKRLDDRKGTPRRACAHLASAHVRELLLLGHLTAGSFLSRRIAPTGAASAPLAAVASARKPRYCFGRKRGAAAEPRLHRVRLRRHRGVSAARGMQTTRGCR